jgi:membrane-bound serine protease (ClpP class)
VNKRVVQAFLAAVAVVAAVAVPAAAATERPLVRVIELDNDINPVTADFVVDELENANRSAADAVVIELDTPGGLSTSMNKIVKTILASRKPVIVYVSPEGARAASAGVWIGQAADILAMAPQTNIGSSTPISAGGGEIKGDSRRKVVNDAAASLRALAREHGRNVGWVDRAVRQASNLAAREALDMNVIDAIAPTLPRLLTQLDGERTTPKGHVLDLAGARLERVELSGWKRILDLLIDPNIVVLLMSIGTLGLIVELWNPGLVLPGTVGAISLILGLFGLSVLPISLAGLLLMLLALGLWGADLFVPSHGALTLAGGVAFVLGGLLLFDPAGDVYEVSLILVLTIAGTLALFFAVAVAKIFQARRRPAEVGVSRMRGASGVARGDRLVFVNGELWQAVAEDGRPLEPGERVTVDDVEGLRLVVHRA